MRSFSIGFCLFQNKYIFIFLVPKRRNKRMDEHSDSAANQSEDEDHDHNHDKNHKKINPAEIKRAKQLLLEKITTFEMIHENKCPDGKSSSNKTRMESLNEIQTLFENCGCKHH